jgi:hypothetical protein
VISPEEMTMVIGGLIKLDGRSSISPEGDELTYAWEILETPLGSTVDSYLAVEEDNSSITFVPDKTGEYVVGLTVSTPYRSSNQVTASIQIQAILTPYLLRTTPDGSQMFNVLSSFWDFVEEKQVFSTIWSGYMQAIGADLLRLYQVDFSKSIRTIQPLFQRRWLLYAPSLELDFRLHSGVFGRHQSGERAFTASGSAAAIGCIVGAQEMILFDGTPTSEAVGEEVKVYTSAGTPGNVGSYLVNRVNADGTGYIVSASSPFPSPEEEILDSGTDLVTFSTEKEVSVSDLAHDFSSLGVGAGDVLRIESGAGAGYYRITAVGTEDGLPNERTLTLDRAPTLSLSGRPYAIFKALRIYAQRVPSARTNTVYLPESEADLSQFETAQLSGSGSIENVFEVKVEARHVFEALIGRQITITSGADGGQTFTIASLNASRTGYLVSASFGASTFPEAVSYTIPSVSDISSRVLILGSRAYEIVNAVLDTTGASEEDGGYGSVWVVTLPEPQAPAGQENLSWRIAGSIISEEFEDFEAEGVSEGDLLQIEVLRKDNKRTSLLPCTVLGAVGNKIAFDIGTTDIELGTNGVLSDAEILSLSQDLYIPRVSADPLDENEIIISLSAAEIQALLQSREFQTRYYNLPMSASTVIDLDLYLVHLRAVRVVRNRRIPVDETVTSIPSLFEYIDTPQFVEDTEEGTIFLAGKDASLTSIVREPLELLENRDYTVSSEGSLVGSNCETTANSGLFKIPKGDLLDRDVQIGDFLVLSSGFDQDKYFIQALLDSETLRAASVGGGVPSTTASGVSFTIQKRSKGAFLRFVEGMFSPSLPAPEHLWAQTTLFDNSAYLEDNFGLLVGVTKAQLDAYGSSQISYKGAITALMYAWTHGPTIKNIATGCQVLVGLPVTETAGRIVQIDPVYDPAKGTGRVLIEDIDEEGSGTGLIRIYLYPAAADEDTLGDFAGLAINPSTGAPFTLEDVVHPFQMLSRSVVVSDYVTNPQWWKDGDRKEIQKFHSWQVELDAHQIDSKDMGLIYDFCMGIRPIYTFPHLSLVLYLSDEAEITDQMTLMPTLFLSDDPALSLESSHMLDSYNGSSLPNRILDLGTFSTRTFFEGRDLVTEAGSGTVTSARGGFSPLAADGALDHAPDEALTALSGINEWFEGETFVRGLSVVEAGDILFIREGPNRGRYLITEVTSDTTLEVTSLPDWPPRTRAIENIEVGAEQVFQIQRLDSDILTTGTLIVESYDADADLTTIVDEDGNFRWSGVAVGDTLVIEEGDDYGCHQILQVGKLDETYDPDGSESPQEHLESLEKHLIIAGNLTGLGNASYYVRRSLLRKNPILERSEDGSVVSGQTTVTSTQGGLLLEDIQYGDLLIYTAPATVDMNTTFKVIDVPDDFTIVVDRPFQVAQPGLGGPTLVSYQILRPAAYEADESQSQDGALETLSPHDEVEIKILHPMAAGIVRTDLTLSGNTATATVDLEALGIQVGMRLEITAAAESSGAYKITGVSGNTVTVSYNFTADETPATGGFFYLDDAWQVVGDQVTLSGTLNLEFGPMLSVEFPEAFTSTFNAASPRTFIGSGTSFTTAFQIGDIIRLEGDDDDDWAIIEEILSDTAITLDRDYTGVSPATGRVERGTPGGMVRPGDRFYFSEGVFVVKSVQASTMTLTADTGVSPVANFTGKVTRALR